MVVVVVAVVVVVVVWWSGDGGRLLDLKGLSSVERIEYLFDDDGQLRCC